MVKIARGVLLVLALGCTASADVPKNIFDDDWVPPASEQAHPATPAPPVNPNPDPNPVLTPKPVTPMPTPDSPTPAPEIVAPQPARLAVPNTAAQADAWKLIKSDLYKDDIARAKTAAQKVELAKKLLTVADETTKDVVGRYVLLAQAKELAIGSGDPPTAFKCLDEMGKAYNIDYPVMKLDLFASLSKTVSAPSDMLVVTEGLNRWADAQVKSDRYDAAKKACDIALTVAHKDPANKLVNPTLQHKKEVVEIETAYASAKAAMATLAVKPSDPAANLALGRFYCFMKGDWEKGLPMLAAGSDAALKELAAKELANPSAADAQMAIGDGWWDLMGTEKGLTQERLRHHAVKWYTDASPNLEGLFKLKVQKRLASAESQIAGAQSPLLPCTLLDQNGNKVVNGIELRDNVRATTEEKFSPPVEFIVVVRTDSISGNDFRITYAADQIIFNWDGNPKELRVDGGPANGDHMGNFGRVPINQWMQIRLQVLPDEMNIFVDGKQRYHTQADFSKVDQTFAIRAAGGCNLKVRSLVAQKVKEKEK